MQGSIDWTCSWAWKTSGISKHAWQNVTGGFDSMPKQKESAGYQLVVDDESSSGVGGAGGA